MSCAGRISLPREAYAPLSAFVAMGLFWGAWAALVPEIQQRLGASLPELGAALLWAGAAAVPAMLIAGRLWSRFGPSLVWVTLLLFGLATVGPALAPSVLALGVALATVGAASGALDVAMNAQVSELEEATGRRLMYLAHALFSLAVLVMSVSAGALRSIGVGPLPILAAVAVVFAGVTLLAYLGARRHNTPRHNPPPARPPRAAEAPDGGQALRPVLRGAVLLLGLLCAAAFLIEDALTSWSALHLERTLGADPAIGGAGPGLFAGAMFVGRSLGQAVSRRFADREVLTGAGAIAAAGILVVAVAPSAPIALGGLIVAGIGISLVAPALFSRAGWLAGARGRGPAIAGLTVFGYLGFVVGPPLVGLIAGLTDLRLSFAALAILAAGLALVARLRIGDPQPLAEEELPPVTRA